MEYRAIIKRTSNDELYHYGVKGMKWGIRRDARILANHRRNVAVKDIKSKYKSGKISKDEAKTQIQAANKKKNSDIKSVRDKVDVTYNENKLAKMRNDISKQTVKEVPRATLKRGLTTVNSMLGGLHTAQMVGVGLTSLAYTTTIGPALMAGAAVGAAAEVGMHYLAQRGIDKLS